VAGKYLVPSANGVTVLDLRTALLEYPELVHPHLGSLVPLDSADPLDGTFIHVAAGVAVPDPLQTFFGREAERMAATSRTLIVAEPESSVAYIEGCAAPIYTRHTDRRSTVEIVVGAGATVRHATIQNWSTNVRHTVLKHATVGDDGKVEWLDAALGSSETTTRLVTRLRGKAAAASVISMLSAGSGQRHDAEVLIAHEGEETSSNTLSKLLGRSDGSVRSRHVLQMEATSSCATTTSEALCIDGGPEFHQSCEKSGDGAKQIVAFTTERHVEDLHLEYLMRRGLSRAEAVGMVVTGHLSQIAGKLPLEYAVEWDRAIQLELEQVIG